MTDSKMPERIWAADYDDTDGGGYWWLDQYANTGLVEYIRADLAHPAPAPDAELDAHIPTGLISIWYDAASEMLHECDDWLKLKRGQHPAAQGLNFAETERRREIARLLFLDLAWLTGKSELDAQPDRLTALRARTAQPVSAQCCMCGKTGLSTEEDGGPECELHDGRWVCSGECWEVASNLVGRTAQPVGVRVRNLEWKTHDDKYDGGRSHYGTGIFGHWYCINRAQNGEWLLMHHVDGRPYHFSPAASLQAAKAAAQSDYKQRILSALLPEGCATCRKCGGEMKPGIAMGQTLTGGTPDFPGDDEAITLSAGGPGQVIGAMKCSACGWSVTGGGA